MPVPTSELVAATTAAWLNDCVSTSAAARSKLRRRLRRENASPPDYDRVHAAFAAEFLLVNYRKCAEALDAARPAPTGTVVDLGCGSGAAAVAALVYLFNHRLNKVTVHLLDRSARQLELASALVRAVADRLGEERRFEVDIRTACGDWPTEKVADVSKPAMVVASHVLTENPRRASDFLDQAVGLAGPQGSLTVIERGDDRLWAVLEAQARESVLVRRTGCLDVHAPTADGTSRTWATRWLTFEPGPYQHCERAVRGYLTAWRKRDPDHLPAVFAEEAIYQDKPFQPAIEGLAGIREYWRKEVASQRSVAVVVESVAYRPDGAHLEWTARLARGEDTVKVVYGFMVMEISSSGLIRELRECYRSQREPCDATVGSGPGDL